MAKILIVEDEEPVNELIRRNLELVGHQCRSVYDGKAALDALAEGSYDLMLLDVMLPELDGFDVFEQNREQPTIFLTARNGLSDRLRGLTMGADDYMVKPFEMLEMLARVEAVLRRTQTQRKDFEIAGVRVDFESRRVWRNGVEIDCSPKEYELLETLAVNRNIALSRERLLELVWGYDFEGDTRTVDVHIQRLRKKLGLEKQIRTVYKLGYRLETDR
ncbi:MAG: response regulator transcription factor [Oscillospiraceae bacterium]|mgnify:CR=1 FL=1|nr:response regulator transcription factor [Oscillospiraceae bacterium]